MQETVHLPLLFVILMENRYRFFVMLTKNHWGIDNCMRGGV